jgi:hypothetical protein
VSASGDVCFYVYGKAHLIVDVWGLLPDVISGQVMTRN